MGRAPPGQDIKAARGVICAFARAREERRAGALPAPCGLVHPIDSASEVSEGSGGEPRGSCCAMGLCCCKDWRGHLQAPKGNSGRARASCVCGGHTPRWSPQCPGTALTCPAFPLFPASNSRLGPPPNSGTRGVGGGPGVRAEQRSLGIREVGGHGRQVGQVRRCTGPRDPRITPVAG